MNGQIDLLQTQADFDGALERPLLADARDRTWHIGTFSKTLCPGRHFASTTIQALAAVLGGNLVVAVAQVLEQPHLRGVARPRVLDDV